jgi:hypothetical protein
MMGDNLKALEVIVRDRLLADRDLSFAADLCRQAFEGRRPLSGKQWAWIDRLVAKANRPAAKTVEVRGAIAEIFALFTRAAAAGLKFPKIRLAADDDTPVVFSRAGEKSRYTGEIMVTDGGPFGSNRYFGRIDAAGYLHEGRDLTYSVRTLIENFAADPAGVAAIYGKRTGSCCFCRKELSTRESLAVGYGPICAEKFGLPWGEIAPVVDGTIEVRNDREGGEATFDAPVRIVTHTALTM